MGLFGKKKEENAPELLPNLPEPNNPNMPSLPEISSQNLPPNNLPSLPESNPNMDQQTIKQGIEEPTFGLTQSPGGLVAEPMETFDQSIPGALPQQLDPNAPRIIEMSANQKVDFKTTKKLEPLFIRLDKFESSLEALEEIRSRVMEIEKVLAKTKEIKQKEDQELDEGEKDIQIIKSKLQTIDSSIFKKIE